MVFGLGAACVVVVVVFVDGGSGGQRQRQHRRRRRRWRQYKLRYYAEATPLLWFPPVSARKPSRKRFNCVSALIIKDVESAVSVWLLVGFGAFSIYHKN